MAGVMSTLQFRHRIDQRRREGKPLTEDEINYITNESADLGHTSSNTDDSDQLRWAAKAEQVLSKPANEITDEDAKAVTSRETRAFEGLPACGSVASHVQSVADKNNNQ